MQLKIDNISQPFIPIQKFRAEWNLPEAFSLAYFEPKDGQDLGSMEGSGALLAQVKQQVIQSVPVSIVLSQLLQAVDVLTQTFEHYFNRANDKIGLRMVEVDFAVAGFRDVMQAVVYKVVQIAHNPDQTMADFAFDTIYQQWLDDSVRLATKRYRYIHEGRQFELFVVNNAYGRVGMEVHIAGTCTYVLDTSLACPAANYMKDLCRDVTRTLLEALT